MTCIECVLSATYLMAGSANEDPMFSSEKPEYAVGTSTDDSIANLRSSIRYTLRDMVQSWVWEKITHYRLR